VLPGAGAHMHQSSIDTYVFPSGDYWMNGGNT